MHVIAHYMLAHYSHLLETLPDFDTLENACDISMNEINESLGELFGQFSIAKTELDRRLKNGDDVSKFSEFKTTVEIQEREMIEVKETRDVTMVGLTNLYKMFSEGNDTKSSDFFKYWDGFLKNLKGAITDLKTNEKIAQYFDLKREKSEKIKKASETPQKKTEEKKPISQTSTKTDDNSGGKYSDEKPKPKDQTVSPSHKSELALN